jgi:HTH-type transcriptional regulator / antitoxin HigA
MEGILMTLAATRDQYAALIRKFPPRPLHTLRDYNVAVAVMNKLAVKDEESLTADEADYLDALATFVEKYDREHYPAPSESTPLERLRYLVDESGISASDLGRILGNRGLGSILLTGRRELSKSQIRTLATHFKISPAYFI